MKTTIMHRRPLHVRFAAAWEIALGQLTEVWMSVRKQPAHLDLDDYFVNKETENCNADYTLGVQNPQEFADLDEYYRARTDNPRPRGLDSDLDLGVNQPRDLDFGMNRRDGDPSDDIADDNSDFMNQQDIDVSDEYTDDDYDPLVELDALAASQLDGVYEDGFGNRSAISSRRRLDVPRRTYRPFTDFGNEIETNDSVRNIFPSDSRVNEQYSVTQSWLETACDNIAFAVLLVFFAVKKSVYGALTVMDALFFQIPADIVYLLLRPFKRFMHDNIDTQPPPSQRRNPSASAKFIITIIYLSIATLTFSSINIETQETALSERLLLTPYYIKTSLQHWMQTVFNHRAGLIPTAPDEDDPTSEKQYHGKAPAIHLGELLNEMRPHFVARSEMLADRQALNDELRKLESKFQVPTWQQLLDQDKDMIQSFLEQNMEHFLASQAERGLMLSKDALIRILEEERRNDDGRKISEIVVDDDDWPHTSLSDVDNFREIPSHQRLLISAYVSRILQQYQQDLLSLPDFALATRGARIIPRLTSPTYTQTAQRPIKHFLAGLLGVDQPRVPSPIIALLPETHVGQCWPMRGSNGTLGVMLSQPITIQSITVEYPSRHIAVNASSAPKDIEVWGLRQIPSSPFGTVEWPWTPKHESNTDAVFLCSMQYDIRKSSPVQTFSVDLNRYIPLKGVLFRFTSNWGNNLYTCIYRVRVHGVPSDNVYYQEA